MSSKRVGESLKSKALDEIETFQMFPSCVVARIDSTFGGTPMPVAETHRRWTADSMRL